MWPVQSKQTEKSYSTRCPYCSVQCSMDEVEIHGPEGVRFKVRPNKKDTTSEGRICVKGTQAHQQVLNKERIKTPLLKINGEFKKVSWDVALQHIERNFKQIQKIDGYDALAVYGGGSLTNEEAYLLGKFARVGLKTKHIDYNGRYCMSSAATAANLAFGIDRGLTMELSEIPNAKCIILAGTNLAECQPTLMPYFQKAKKNGAFIIVIDPRETATTKFADIHLKVKPGSDAILVNGLLKVIIEQKLIDTSFVGERTKGFEGLVQHLQSIHLEQVEELTGVDQGLLIKAAEMFGEAVTGMVFTARGVEQHSSGVETVKNFINLLLVTGKIGRASCGYGAITGQANGQGGREHGLKADQLPGYRSIENIEHRKHIADIWGIEEKEIPTKGVSAYEMIEKINDKEITGLFIMASNPVVSSPHANFVDQALGKLKYLVVVDFYLSETARKADLILPSTSYMEDYGTITNLEGKVVLREGTRKKYAESKHDWEIVCEIAKKMGKQEYFQYSSAEDIFNELRRASRGGVADYSGITYERIKKELGVFWPCPENHPGEKHLFKEMFHHHDGKAIIFTVKSQYPKESATEEYPLILTTGRVMHHYLTGVQTRRSSKLTSLSSEPFLEIHPDTAENFGIGDHQLVRVQSERGEMIVRSKYKKGIRKDTVFTSFHWGGIQSVNRVTNPALEPLCKMPEFKVSAVKISLMN